MILAWERGTLVDVQRLLKYVSERELAEKGKTHGPR